MSYPVVIDCDGVLADFEGSFCENFGWERRRFDKLEYRYPGRAEEIGWFVQSPMTYENLDIIDTGVKIARFCENAGFDIHIVTCRPKQTEISTGWWLKQNGIPFTSLSVHTVKTGKIEMINPLFAVDDRLDVAEQLAEVGIPVFLLDWPWNQKDDLDGIIYRIETFDDFVTTFERYFDI